MSRLEACGAAMPASQSRRAEGDDAAAARAGRVLRCAVRGCLRRLRLYRLTAAHGQSVMLSSVQSPVSTVQHPAASPTLQPCNMLPFCAAAAFGADVRFGHGVRPLLALATPVEDHRGTGLVHLPVCTVQRSWCASPLRRVDGRAREIGAVSPSPTAAAAKAGPATTVGGGLRRLLGLDGLDGLRVRAHSVVPPAGHNTARCAASADLSVGSPAFQKQHLPGPRRASSAYWPLVDLIVEPDPAVLWCCGALLAALCR